METQSPGKIQSKLIAIMRSVDAIGKSRSNAQQGFKFRGIDEMYNELHSKFAEHGVFTTTEVLDQKREERQTKTGGNLTSVMLTIRFTFHAEDGSSISSILLGEAMDSGDKASNKAISIAHKYALLTMFMIPTEDPKDPDAESHDVAPKASKTDRHPPPAPIRPIPAGPTYQGHPINEASPKFAQSAKETIILQGGPMPTAATKLASEAQLKRLYAIAKSTGVDMDTIHAYIERTYGLKSTKELDWKQYNAVVEWVQLPASDPFADVIEPKSDYENMRRDNVWKPDQN